MSQWTNHFWFRYWLIAWSAPSHYLNQWWNSVNWTLKNKLQWNFSRYSYIFIKDGAFENVVWKMADILSRPQCAKKALEHIPLAKCTSVVSPLVSHGSHQNLALSHRYTIIRSGVVSCGWWPDLYVSWAVFSVNVELRWLWCQNRFWEVWWSFPWPWSSLSPSQASANRIWRHPGTESSSVWRLLWGCFCRAVWKSTLMLWWLVRIVNTGDYAVYEFSQGETTLHCNVMSLAAPIPRMISEHWLVGIAGTLFAEEAYIRTCHGW